MNISIFCSGIMYTFLVLTAYVLCLMYVIVSDNGNICFILCNFVGGRGGGGTSSAHGNRGTLDRKLCNK